MCVCVCGGRAGGHACGQLDAGGLQAVLEQALAGVGQRGPGVSQWLSGACLCVCECSQSRVGGSSIVDTVTHSRAHTHASRPLTASTQSSHFSRSHTHNPHISPGHTHTHTHTHTILTLLQVMDILQSLGSLAPNMHITDVHMRAMFAAIDADESGTVDW